MTSIAAIAPRFSFTGSVSFVERLSRFLFGSPSFAYACRDMRLRGRPLRVTAEDGSRAVSPVPVFAIDRRWWQGVERLPRIWLSEPTVVDAGSAASSRVFMEAYPHDPDPDGWHAHDLAKKFFSEGLGYAPSDRGAMSEEEEAMRQRRARRDCFRAAEVLFLHAMKAGNDAAMTGLAAIYRHDLCEGAYWSGLREKRARHRKAIDPRRRALRLYERAANAGSAEASLAYGEMLMNGEGCEVDAGKAFRCFEHAFDVASVAGERFVAGTAALRMAGCFEGGVGASHGFARAEKLYLQAIGLLQEAFDEGQWHCKRQLVEARLGAARMAQELHGGY